MIKEILQNLPKEDYEQIMYAFEQEQTCFIILSDKRHYLGVNTSNLKNLSVEQCAGNFYYGEIKYDNNHK